jgi:RNA polymerase sigma factor (sigma-70 family)
VAGAHHRTESSPPERVSLSSQSLANSAGKDRAGFSEELYATVAPVINKLLWALLGPDSERDDLAHEIFLRILQRADQLRDRSRLQPWAARLAVNAVKNEFRRRKLRRWLSLDAEDERSPSYHPDFEGREVLLHTYGVLAKLPARERVALTLHLIGQQPIDEIALVTGCSGRTVKRRLRAGRERFLRLAAADPLLAERLRQSPIREDDDDA